MNKFTHVAAALKTACFCQQKRLKNHLGIKGKPTSRVMDQGIDTAVERYTRICETLKAHLPGDLDLKDAVACEIGCGDCFAAADMMLGLGARHVHLVEFQPLELSHEHLAAISRMSGKNGLPNRGEIVEDGNPPHLAAAKATYHQGLLEDTRIPEKVDLLYSFDVLEHVEDLDGFFSYCGEVVKPGGYMLHKFDLSGHGLFEDPMPPLDFQTFPKWLFDLIFPKYMRAVGNFADEFLTVMEKHGFTDFKTIPIRTAEPAYLDAVWPHLRPEAHTRSKENVSLLDLVVVSRRRED